MSKESYRVTVDLVVPPSEVNPDAAVVLCSNLQFHIYCDPAELAERVANIFPRFYTYITDVQLFHNS